MRYFKWTAAIAFGAAAAFSVLLAAPVAAENDDEDIYVAPSDEDSSDEALREEAGSGFDTPGPFYINEDDYNAGDQGDGTWAPDIPEPEADEDTDDGN